MNFEKLKKWLRHVKTGECQPANSRRGIGLRLFGIWRKTMLWWCYSEYISRLKYVHLTREEILELTRENLEMRENVSLHACIVYDFRLNFTLNSFSKLLMKNQVRTSWPRRIFRRKKMNFSCPGKVKDNKDVNSYFQNKYHDPIIFTSGCTSTEI